MVFVLLLQGCDGIFTDRGADSGFKVLPDSTEVPDTQPSGEGDPKSPGRREQMLANYRLNLDPEATPVLITEVMSKNQAVLRVENLSPDWIELYNSGSEPINISGYRLIPNLREDRAWTVPEGIILGAGEVLLILAAGRSEEEAVQAATKEFERLSGARCLVADFALSADGETIILVTARAQIAAVLELPALPADISLGLSSEPVAGLLEQRIYPRFSGTEPDAPADADQHPGTAFVYYSAPNPGDFRLPAKFYATSAEAAAAIYDDLLGGVVINEYMSRNRRFTDPHGRFSDWVELYNSGSETVDLTGYGFSDRASNLNRYVFPELKVEPGEYVLLWLTGAKSDEEDPEGEEAPRPVEPNLPPETGRYLEVSFALGAKDEELIISDPTGRILLRYPIEHMARDISRGRRSDQPNDQVYFYQPTPGRPNSEYFSLTRPDTAAILQLPLPRLSEISGLDGEYARRAPNTKRDWIELYNPTDREFLLDGFYLTDNRNKIYRESLAGKVIPAEGYLVVFPENFGIAARGETIYLIRDLADEPPSFTKDILPEWDAVDSLNTGKLRNKVTVGRTVDGREGVWLQTSPGQANDPEKLLRPALWRPVISVKQTVGGTEQISDNIYFLDQVTVEITLDQRDPGYRTADGTVPEIRYTIDGSQPTADSLLYSEPLTVDRSVAVRAISVHPEALSSETVARTLLKEPRHDLPIMALSTDADNMYGPNGMWTQFEQYIEHPIQCEYYTVDGKRATSFLAGASLHGSFSRKEIQKQLELNLRPFYGDEYVTYPFFSDNPHNEVDTFNRLILRQSGQDWKYSKLRDGLLTRILRGYINCDYMDISFCVVYLNGEYMGLYEVRENLDRHYVAAHHGADPDNVDILKGNRTILVGSAEDYNDLTQYIRAHDLADDTHYAAVIARMDHISLIDWMISIIFTGNFDSGNKKFWRERTEGSKYRMMLFDLDWALFPSTAHYNLLANLLSPNGHGSGSIFDTSMMRGLMRNKSFRADFLRRFVELFNTALRPERLETLFQQAKAEIISEMPRQIERWGLPKNMAAWEAQTESMHGVLMGRRKHCIGLFREYFGLSESWLRENLLDHDW
ncbi:MAG: hypothetical protein GX900_03570 [Clostridiaceae bacterium]|nr:hypothetical protein [Clostridiaceae bacterium]